MKRARFPVLKAAITLTVIGCFALALPAKVLADGQDHLDDSLDAAKAWVSQIDAAQYEGSYNSASEALHTKVEEDRWVTVLSALRTPWGPVVNRKPLSHIYKPNGLEGAEGEFMVITYDTSFKHLDPATEVVVLHWEGGKWLGAGYTAGPKPTADDNAAPVVPPATTEVHTEEHVKPQPKATP